MTWDWRQWLRVYNRPWLHHMSNWGCLYLILRANFDGLRSEAVPEPPALRKGDGKVEYRPGKRVVGLSYDEDGGIVTVQYVDVTTGEEGSVSSETVIASDGLHSSVAKLLNVPKRGSYAGYIAWRGTVPESLLSQETIDYFSNRLNFTLMGGTYFIRYKISSTTSCRLSTDLSQAISSQRKPAKPSQASVFSIGRGILSYRTAPQICEKYSRT